MSGGPAELAIERAASPQRARLTVSGAPVDITPTVKSASVMLTPEGARTAVLVRFGEARLGAKSVVPASSVVWLEHGEIVAGPKPAYPDALDVRPSKPTEIYYDASPPPVRFIVPEQAANSQTPRQMQWSTRQDFAKIEAAEVLQKSSFARDRLPEGRSYFRSTDAPGDVGELLVEHDASQACADCRADNTIDDTGERVVVHYENRVPHVRLRWNQDGQNSNSTLYVFKDSDLKVPVLQEETNKISKDLPDALLTEGAYYWYVANALSKDRPAATAINTLKIEHELQTEGLALVVPRLSQKVRRRRLMSSGRVAQGATLTLNGKVVAVRPDGSFKVPVRLGEGSNRLVYRVTEPSQSAKYYIRDVTFHH